MNNQHARRLAAALTLALALAACKGGESPGPAKRGGPRERPPAAVLTAPVAERTLAEALSLSGTLEAERQVAVAPRQQGRLLAVTVKLGDTVAKGQVVARLDDADLRARVAQAEAAVASARASVSQRAIEHGNLARQAERSRELLAKDFIARQDEENARTAAASSRVLVDLAKSELARAQAALAEARQALGETALVAPMAGVVAARHLDPGALASAGAPVVTLVAPGALKAVVSVAEQALPRLAPGGSATVSVDAWPGTDFKARVSRVAPVVAPDTRMGQVELTVADPEGKLRPGMFARVRLVLTEREGVPAVPRAAVVEREGARGVFVPEGGSVRFVPVTLGLSDETHAELIEGPKAGTPVVTEGADGLKDGAAIMTGDRPAGRRKQGRDQ